MQPFYLVTKYVFEDIENVKVRGVHFFLSNLDMNELLEMALII
jgi:hypothetical protein